MHITRVQYPHFAKKVSHIRIIAVLLKALNSISFSSLLKSSQDSGSLLPKNCVVECFNVNMSDQAYEQRIASAINEIKSKIRNSQGLSLDLGDILDDQNLRAGVIGKMKREACNERERNGPNPTDLASLLWKLFLNLPAPDPPKKSLRKVCLPHFRKVQLVLLFTTTTKSFRLIKNPFLMIILII